MVLKVNDLLSKLERMLETGEITPDSDVIIGHYTKGPEGLIEDLYYWGLDSIYQSPEDDFKPEEERRTILVIEAYNEPLND